MIMISGDSNDDNNEEEVVENGGIYGMHILDRDNSLKRRPDNDDDEAAVGIFNDLCDELGVTPNTHPGIHNGLHHFYHQHRSTRYKYPIFRSKKFKLGILYVTILLLILLISVAIISAITNGYESVRLKKNEPPQMIASNSSIPHSRACIWRLMAGVVTLATGRAQQTIRNQSA